MAKNRNKKNKKDGVAAMETSSPKKPDLPQGFKEKKVIVEFRRHRGVSGNLLKVFFDKLRLRWGDRGMADRR
ncbi:hypothetical protein GIB67_025141 [Kingdonia uniflora]|uniref:Uncharacterized protein n=1 Tax=Kingdonia uniflora TaxID=39325 RepID=A0A7J7N820_9MAGN|nr:hypothetical protein GIB67_025141 [Kingdonia uniflora]